MSLLDGYLDNYVTKTPENNLDIINDLFKNDFSDVEVVIIHSQQGCGGTHLLRHIGKELIARNKNVYCISGEKLMKAFSNEREAVEEFLHKQSYLLVDDLSFLINHLDCLKWLNSFLKSFTLNGGRFIFTNTGTGLTTNDWLVHIGKYKVTEITSTYPSAETLRQIAMEQLPIRVVSKHFDEACKSSNSIREMLSILVTYDANYKLGIM
tara:strand:- start:6915 stop:7541 length:627 start_codon:yes stop_codon:yes gene_type:complete